MASNIATVAGEKAIAHLLTSTASDIKSIFSFDCDELYNETELRRRYRKIALLVHPDKSKCENAESAFKILTNALENLLAQLSSEGNRLWGESTPDISKETAEASTSERRSSNFGTAEKKWSRNQENEAFHSCDTSTKSTINSRALNERNKLREAETKKMREYWAAAEEEFLSEILKNRINREVCKKRKMTEKNESSRERDIALEIECCERQKDIESRASCWKLWSEKHKNNSSNDFKKRSRSDYKFSEIRKIPEDNNQKIENSSRVACVIKNYSSISRDCCLHEKSIVDRKDIICSVCQRMFSTFDALIKHERVSELHQSNLLKECRSKHVLFHSNPPPPLPPLPPPPPIYKWVTHFL